MTNTATTPSGQPLGISHKPSATEAMFDRLKAENKPAFIGYLPYGFPNPDISLDALRTMIEHGVDAVEIGLPYSDPVMDGPVIQAASQIALNNGESINGVFKAVETVANADLVHVDVMDHHFVPNLTLGEPIVKRICEVTDLPVDVHLMIEDPDRWAPEYAKLGAASISFHMGATHAPVRLARQLRDMGCKACFAVRPAEPVEPIFDILDEFDMVLIMTVEPGFGGQKFLDNQMAKVRRLRDEITRRGLSTHIQVDGGVSPKTAHIVAEAGADVLVAGSAVYGAESPAQAIDQIRDKAAAAYRD